MKKLKTILIAIALTLISSQAVLAETAPLAGLKNVQEPAGFDEGQNSTDAMAEFVGMIVQLFLGILGIIFVILMLYAGYKWMMAQGEEKNIEQAKHTIQRAIIGLIIVLSSFAIWNLISTKIFPVN